MTSTGFGYWIDLSNNSGLWCTDASFDRIGYEIGYPIAINLPDMTQIDFIKHIMQELGMLVDTDINTRTVTFTKFTEIAGSEKDGTSQNYNDKIDLSEEKEVENIQNDYDFKRLGIKNDIQYRTDSNDNRVRSSLRKYTFPLTGQNYIGSKDFIKFWFAASFNIIRLTQQVSVPFIDVMTNDGTNIFRDKEHVPRFLRLRTANFSSLFYSEDAGSTTDTVSTDVPFAEFDGYLDPETVKDNYYTEYIAALNEPDTPNPHFYLTIADFNDFSHLKLVYLQGGYYFAYEIPSFVVDKSTVIKLLKV
jgi:hypothetical protein